MNLQGSRKMCPYNRHFNELIVKLQTKPKMKKKKLYYQPKCSSIWDWQTILDLVKLNFDIHMYKNTYNCSEHWKGGIVCLDYVTTNKQTKK